MRDGMKSALPKLEDLLADGFTKRMAASYLGILETERASGLFDADYLEWAHAHGFCAESAYAYGLSDANLGSYLSDYDYWRLWPLNDWQRIWINDKLTLNALLSDSELAQYLPRYHYYSSRGHLLPLGEGDGAGMEGFLACLRREGELACKPCNGSEANGFFKLAFEDGSYLLNGRPVGVEGVGRFVAENPNYVFTEFIHPNAQLAAIDPLIHTMRVLVLNPTGIDPVPAASYLRFAVGVDETGSSANYQAPTTADICSYNVGVDLSCGRYGGGKVVYAAKVVDSPKHPTSGTLAEGQIDCWPQMLEMMRRISLKVRACEYLGFDACVTDKGPRIMEINSHSGVKYLQLFTPIMEDARLSEYFSSKIAAIDVLGEADRAARNGIVR